MVSNVNDHHPIDEDRISELMTNKFCNFFSYKILTRKNYYKFLYNFSNKFFQNQKKTFERNQKKKSISTQVG